MSKIKDELESPAMDQSLDEIIPKWNVKVHRNIFRQCYMAGYEGGMAEARTEIERLNVQFAEAHKLAWETEKNRMLLIDENSILCRTIGEARALLSRMAEALKLALNEEYASDYASNKSREALAEYENAQTPKIEDEEHNAIMDEISDKWGSSE